MIYFRRSVPLLIAVIAVILGTVQPAYAAVVLTPNTATVTNTPGQYQFATYLQYWSVIALRPVAGADYDLQLLDAGSNPLASSVWGMGATDLVAINSTSGYRPLGGYLTNVTKYSGSGDYAVMFWEKRQVMSVPTDPVGNTSTALALNYAWPVSATMVYLQANQGFRVHHDSSTRVYLAGSTPGVPSSGLRNRSSLENAYVVADNVPSPSGGVCRVFVAPTPGWYSVITIWNTPLTPPPYNGGVAVFPQRYDPTLGDTLSQCPQPAIP